MSYSRPYKPHKGYRKKKTAPFTGPTRATILKSNRDGWLKVIAPWIPNVTPDFVDELKSTIQPSHRQWNPDEKFWLINEVYLEDLIIILKRHYNEVTTDLIEGQSEPDDPDNPDNSDNLFAKVFEILPDGDYADKVYYALAQAIHPDHGGNDKLVDELNKAYQRRNNE